MYSNEYEDEQEEQQSENFLVNFYHNNKILVWIFIGIILFILIMSLLTKGGSNNKTNITYDVTLSPEGELFVNIGRSDNIIATVTNDPKATFTWSVADETIVKVDNGNVTGLDYGKTEVTATYIDSKNEKHSASKTVTVGDGDPNIPLTNVSFKEGDLFMPLNDTYQIALTLNPSRGFIQNEKFTSSNPSVATVDNRGVVKSVGEGESTITFDVNNGQFRKELKVYVNRNYTKKEIIVTPERISFDGELRKIKVGTVERLTYTLDPQNADPDKLIWESSDENVVTVENGKIRAISEGRSRVTVKSVNGASDTIDIEVESDIVEVTDISLSTNNMYLTVGQSQSIIPVVLPDNASNKALSYTPLNGAVASVVPNDTGTQATITGISAGETSIIVRSTNGVEKILYVTVTGSGSSGGSSSGGSSSGGSSGGGNSQTIKVRVNGDTPEKTCTGQTLKYYSNPTVTITLNGGISQIKYCYSTSSKCTPSTVATSTTSFTISGKGLYTLRIKKFDQSGNEIASSDSGNYYDGALEYYINTKAEGTKCTGGSSGGSSETGGSLYTVNKTLYTTRNASLSNPYINGTQVKFTVTDKNGGYIKIGVVQYRSNYSCVPNTKVTDYKYVTLNVNGQNEICIAEYPNGSSSASNTVYRYVYVTTSDCLQSCKNDTTGYCLNQCTSGGGTSNTTTPTITTSPTTSPRVTTSPSPTATTTATCGKGEYRGTDGKCNPCKVGTYKDVTGNQGCSSCPAGTYQDKTGQTSCKSCPSGQYQNQTGQASCKACSGTVSSDKKSCTTKPTEVYVSEKTGTTYAWAYNLSANKSGTFTNTIKSGVDTSTGNTVSCVKFPSTRYSQAYTYTVGQSALGIPFERAYNGACKADVLVEFKPSDGSSIVTKTVHITLPKLSGYSENYTCAKMTGSTYTNITNCYYTKYSSSTSFINSVNSSGVTDKYVYGCVEKSTGCGSSGKCYDVWKCTRN